MDPDSSNQEPREVPVVPTVEELAEAKRYAQVGLQCTLADMALDVVVLIVFAVAAGPAVDRWLGSLGWLGGGQSLTRVAALGAVLTLLHSLLSLPLSYYSGYAIEHRFGLSNQTRGKWIATWLKKTALTALLLAGVYTGLFAVIWSTAEAWWLVAAIGFLLLSVVLGQLVPVVVVPLFYKVEPLDEDEHTGRRNAMAANAGLTIDGVYRLGMSAETAKANAMLAGVGSTRRVLMGDTLLDEFSPAEVDVVIAHELGHHVHRHLPKLLAASALTALAGFYATHHVLIAWTGLTDPADWPAATLPAVVLLLSLFSMVVGPLQNLLSRRFEREADRYAVEAMGDVAAFRSAFLKLARMNKAELEPNPVEVFLLHSHPPIRERLELVGAAVE